jgi:hypothetical protein
LDKDLDGFVVNGEDEEIGEADQEAHEKYIRDLEEDDRQRTKNVI